MLCSLICVVKSWLRSLTLFDRNALKKYCNDLRNYPAVTEDCVVSEKDGWSFMPIDALHVVCIPPWRELNPFYEPLLGYKNGKVVAQTPEMAQTPERPLSSFSPIFMWIGISVRNMFIQSNVLESSGIFQNE